MAASAAASSVIKLLSGLRMSAFLSRFPRQRALDVRAAPIADQAGWHNQQALEAPSNIIPLPLPTAATHLNPAERMWRFLRERTLCRRRLADDDVVIDATCRAWKGSPLDQSDRLPPCLSVSHHINNSVKGYKARC